ncbi:hypothetical protein [Haladaptatus paucihalophilus]|uniref:hypothetical protein n=1 Tax=Haladaptatus paucihalophilus TaxID=367189 RepID=UPI0015C54AD0|nr:hypothetical protein [Haladaptatus paucihalophilus]
MTERNDVLRRREVINKGAAVTAGIAGLTTLSESASAATWDAIYRAESTGGSGSWSVKLDLSNVPSSNWDYETRSWESAADQDGARYDPDTEIIRFFGEVDNGPFSPGYDEIAVSPDPPVVNIYSDSGVSVTKYDA